MGAKGGDIDGEAANDRSGRSVSMPDSNTSASISPSACDSYTVPSGDETYNTSGTYSDTIPDVASCDSVITINLTINTADNRVTPFADPLTANATGASYQWLDCDSGFAPVPGDTKQTFVPSTTGNYAVEVTQSGCTDTSDCYNVTVSGISPNGTEAMNLRI